MPPKSPQHGYNPNKKRTIEDIPAWKNIKYIITSKGSTYVVQPNGKIIRYKLAEKRWYKPMDITVFVPTYEELVKRFGNKQVQEKLGVRNEIEYNNFINYIPLQDAFAIADGDGNILEDNFEVSQKLEDGKKVYLHIYDNTNKRRYLIPVTNQPKIGFSPFEIRNEQGNRISTHLGHPVVHVVTKEG